MFCKPQTRIMKRTSAGLLRSRLRSKEQMVPPSTVRYPGGEKMWSSFLILLELYLYICSYQAMPTYSMRVSVQFDAFSKQVKQANEISGNKLIFVVLNYSVMHGTRKEESLYIYKSFCVCKYRRLEFVKSAKVEEEKKY